MVPAGRQAKLFPISCPLLRPFGTHHPHRRSLLDELRLIYMNIKQTFSLLYFTLLYFNLISSLVLQVQRFELILLFHLSQIIIVNSSKVSISLDSSLFLPFYSWFCFYFFFIPQIFITMCLIYVFKCVCILVKKCSAFVVMCMC